MSGRLQPIVRGRKYSDRNAREAPAAFKASVLNHDGGCVMCRTFRPSRRVKREFYAEINRLDPHHVIAQRYLKVNGLHAHLWDPRNGLCLCRYHHDRHEHFVQRVPRSLLTADNLDFAEDLDCLVGRHVGTVYLDRWYPAEEAA